MVAVGLGGLIMLPKVFNADICDDSLICFLFQTVGYLIAWGLLFLITMAWASEASGVSFDEQKRTLRSMQHRCPYCSKKLPKKYGVRKCPHCTADLD